MARALDETRFGDDNLAAGAALDSLRLLFIRAGFRCHKRPARDMTVKTYLAPRIKRPLLNPRLTLLVGRGGAHSIFVMDIIVFPEDLAALGQLLRPFAKRHQLSYKQLPCSASMWPAGVLTTKLRTRLNGSIDAIEASRLELFLRDLHSVLTPTGLESARAE